MAMNVEAEIRDLKRRVSVIEGSFGFLMQQIRGVHKDLLAFQARTEQRFERVEGRLDRHDGRLDRIEKGVQGLREDLPGIVGNAMRAALREHTGKPRKERERLVTAGRVHAGSPRANGDGPAV